MPENNKTIAHAAADENKDAKSHRSWKRRLVHIVVALLALVIIFIGPWPADNSSWKGRKYAVDTEQRLSVLPIRCDYDKTLQAGIAFKKLPMDEGQPIMGYTDRKPLAATGVESACLVKALTLKKGDTDVTFIACDVLLILEKLHEEVIRRCKLKPYQLYFTATHTHSGPGGWLKGPLLEFFYGKYSPEYFDRMAQTIADTVLESRKQLQPVVTGYTEQALPQLLKNRIDKEMRPFDRLQVLALYPFNAQEQRAEEKPLAVVGTFAAHGTVVRRKVIKFSADYPGYFCSALEKLSGAQMTMFAAGRVGDSRPRVSGVEKAKWMGQVMAESVADKMSVPAADVTPESQALATAQLKVDTMKIRFTIDKNWQLSNVATSWFGTRCSFISAVRIGNSFLVGLPADVSAGVVRELDELAAQNGMQMIVTSFNGGWRGYFTRPETFDAHSVYETRTMALLGKYGGNYFTHLSKKLCQKMLNCQ